MSREQKLIDIIFQVASCIKTERYFRETATHEETMKWVAGQLQQCGFETVPCGASWGVLKNETQIMQ